MELYHTGFDIIEAPDIHFGRQNADFGQGFYLSGNWEFSVRWARERKGRHTYLNTYVLDTAGLSIKRFARDAEWFGYIYRNRNGYGYKDSNLYTHSRCDCGKCSRTTRHRAQSA